MRPALIVATWIAAPIAAILIMTGLWPDLSTAATLACLALAIAPATIVSIASARRAGATGIGTAVILAVCVGLVFGGLYFLAQYRAYYRMGSGVGAVLTALVLLPLALAVGTGLGTLVDARARRRGFGELPAAGLGIGAVALLVVALATFEVIISAPRRAAWANPEGRALRPFLVRTIGLGPREQVDCPEDAVAREACVLQLAYGAGDLHLPAGTRVGPLGGNDDGSRIVLEDSTVVEVWVTEHPAAGLSTMGGIGVDSLRQADTVIAGLPATLSTVKLLSPSSAPEYLGLGFITVDSVTAINFSATTATATSRDAALRFIVRSVTPAG
jgi:hypothetical protein